MMRQLWPLLVGFSIWAAAFLLLYALQALGCVWHWSPSWHRAILLATTLATLVALSVTLAIQLRRSGRDPSTIERTGVILTAATLPVALVLFTPVAFLSLCS